MRASEDVLDALHGLVAGSLKDELTEARNKRDAQGKPVPIPASLILAAMKFLKDNGIDAPAKSPRLSGLASELANIDLEEAAQRLQ